MDEGNRRVEIMQRRRLTRINYRMLVEEREKLLNRDEIGDLLQIEGFSLKVTLVIEKVQLNIERII